MTTVPARGLLAAAAVTTGVVACFDPWAATVSGALTWLLLHRAGVAAPAIRVRALTPDEGAPQLRESLTRAGRLQLVEMQGALMFPTAADIDGILSNHPPWPSYLIIDLRAVAAIDASALNALVHVLDCLTVRGGAFLLLAVPGTRVFDTLHRVGLAPRTLGGTVCFTLHHALQRIAGCHREAPSTQESSGASKSRRLYLVRSV